VMRQFSRRFSDVGAKSYIYPMKSNKTMASSTDAAYRKAVLGLDGARCMSCVFAIEHLGRKLEGAIGIVRKIGYDARVEQRDVG